MKVNYYEDHGNFPTSFRYAIEGVHIITDGLINCEFQATDILDAIKQFNELSNFNYEVVTATKISEDT